jgi:cell division protein FtsW
MESLTNGGWFGLGPGEGIRFLSESHTNFVLTVVVEEFAFIIVCLALLALLAFIVIRRLWRARSSGDS